MAAVEIVYRYLAEPGAGRPMPADGAAAQRRLEAGNQGFAALLAALEAPTGDRGWKSRSMPAMSACSAMAPRRPSGPMPPCSAAPMPACRPS